MIDNTRYLLALNRINGVGPRTILRCLVKWPNLADIFQLPWKDLMVFGFTENLAKAISSFNLNLIDEDLAWQILPKHRILVWGDEDYPDLLKEIYDPPMVLYLKGNLSCLKKPCISIVGTRKPSINGYENAKKFAYGLSMRGVTVVSGLAIGVDTEAHLGSLSAGGATAAVMGTGVDLIYPRKNVLLAEKITDQGLLISEFPLKTLPFAGHFPRRNRIISGLSSATLVIEAAIRSGSLITARFAMEQDRDVLAIPGSISNAQARGCHTLLQQGAKLVVSLDDILEEMNLSTQQTEKIVSNDLFTCENENLVRYIGFEVTSVDQIMERSGMDVKDIMCDLIELELQGIVSSVPGGYMRCK